MKIIKNLHDLSKSLITNDKCFVTIGNFDGVHLGHRAFLNSIKGSCGNEDARLVVVTFIPHPLQILKVQTGFLINTYIERRELLRDLGVDFLVEIDFTRDFSTLTPGEFLEKHILVIPQIKKIFLGHDFQFGTNKTGDFEFAKTFCSSKGIQIISEKEFKVGLFQVSSSAIRQKLLSGSIEEASQLLGRKYFISGRVIKGQGRGKKIGFPTANIILEGERIIPAKGVYVTQVKVNELLFNSVTNIGLNPTFVVDGKLQIETHLLDFHQDIYGEELRVFFVKRIREEKKFMNVNDLISQIRQDVEYAKRSFDQR